MNQYTDNTIILNKDSINIRGIYILWIYQNMDNFVHLKKS